MGGWGGVYDWMCLNHEMMGNYRYWSVILHVLSLQDQSSIFNEMSRGLRVKWSVWIIPTFIFILWYWFCEIPQFQNADAVNTVFYRCIQVGLLNYKWPVTKVRFVDYHGCPCPLANEMHVSQQTNDFIINDVNITSKQRGDVVLTQ